MSYVSTAVAPLPAVHPLKITDFRNLWLGMTVSLFGDQFYFVALPWLILQITGSGVALGTILMTAAVPRAIFMLSGGAATDRLSPRRILLATTSCRMILVSVTAALIYFHGIHLWHLYILALAFGVADAFALPASQVLIPSLVPQEQLPAANAVLAGSSQTCSVAGPAAAGLVLKFRGAATALAVDAASFLFVILALWRLPESSASVARQQAPGLWRPIVEGLRFVAKTGSIRSLMLLVMALNLCVSGPLSVGIAVFAKQRIGSSTAFATMLAAMAAGTLLGSLLPALTKHRQRRRGMFLLVFSAVIGAQMISLGLLHQLIPVLVVLAMLGFGNGLAAIYLQSWFQTNVDRSLLGRVMSVFMFAAFGLLPFSYAVAGMVAGLNLTAMFIGAGMLVLIATSIAAFNRELRAID